MAFEVYKPTYGSGVSLKTMSLADAAFRVCEHDADELTCPACRRNHAVQMGWVKPKQVERSTNPAPMYVEWGRPLVNDIVDIEKMRLSNRFREYGTAAGLDLSNVIIDFHEIRVLAEIHVSRGVCARQLWIRFPHPKDRLVSEELALEWLAIAYPFIESGRKQEWVRTKKLPLPMKFSDSPREPSA